MIYTRIILVLYQATADNDYHLINVIIIIHITKPYSMSETHASQNNQMNYGLVSIFIPIQYGST